MPYVSKCLLALVTPWGRLPVAPFAVMGGLVIAVICALQVTLAIFRDALPPYNVWSISLVVAMWPAFCLTSRRYHDFGHAAFWLVGLLILTFAASLTVFDNLHLANSDFDDDRLFLSLAERVRLGLQAISLIVMGYALSRPGDDGDNAFGQPFIVTQGFRPSFAIGPLADETGQIAGLNGPQKKVAAVEPKRRSLIRQEFLMLAQRGRITPGEAARRRREDFGRR